MKTRMPLGDFLVAYLDKLGVKHLFGIPGDLVMRLFLRFGRRRGLRIVTMSHEPGVGFAADGYARATGRIGVVCVTYGAGGHNMVNPVAGSFSERVPLLVISGGPGDEAEDTFEGNGHSRSLRSRVADRIDDCQWPLAIAGAPPGDGAPAGAHDTQLQPAKSITRAAVHPWAQSFSRNAIKSSFCAGVSDSASPFGSSGGLTAGISSDGRAPITKRL